ncbi:MAG: AAA family ATPase, partial [Candidatus Paceibacterota bacterium]
MLKRLELSGFKSFAKKSALEFNAPVTAIVGPNGSGKSNVAESIRFVLGEQSIKSLRSKKGEDLIWNGSKSVSQMNRAAVSITFDNSKKVFKLEGDSSGDLSLNFDEITISREVYRDGVNKYLINGSQVRLRDIIELLSSVNIGASGHHIISQGEADRVLNASAKDRRVMIEEALGLKIYHWKINESDRKLEKTNENLDKAESLRRELLPHIKFLKKQVEKIEKAEEMRIRLSDIYAEYLKKEETYINREKERAKGDKHSAETELSRIDSEIKAIKEALARKGEDSSRTDELRRLDSELRRLRSEQDELSRNLGRIEAKMEFIAREERVLKTKQGEASARTVPFAEVEGLAKTIEAAFSEADNAPSMIPGIIARIRRLFGEFLSKHRGGGDDIAAKIAAIREELSQAENEKREIEKSLASIVAREDECNRALNRVKEENDKNKDQNRDRERLYYELIAKRSDVAGRLNVILSRLELIEREEASFTEEIKEGNALIGQEILKYKRQMIDEAAFRSEPRSEQEIKRKEIEKLKIRLEDMGGAGGSEMLKEYKDMEERDQFLTREIEDLKKSAESLTSLI